MEWCNLHEALVKNLERPFTEEEIVVVLKECNPTKAPRPDGLNIGWTNKMWHLISNKVLDFFFTFHYTAKIPKGANSSFIAIIPKSKNQVYINDFRPISLINCSIKILLTVLANRLKPCLTNIIFEEQTTFL